MQFKVSLSDKAIRQPCFLSCFASHSHLISAEMGMRWEIGVCAVNLSLCKLKETGFCCAALKMCIFPCCIVLNLNDFRERFYSSTYFSHFVTLIACEADRGWPVFGKCILLIKETTRSQTLLIWRGVWAWQSECVFSSCYTVNTSLTFDWIWRKLLHKPLEHSTERKPQKGAASIYDPGS